MLELTRVVCVCRTRLGVGRRKFSVRVDEMINHTYYALLAYLYLDVLQLRPFQAGLRISAVLFSGLAAAVSGCS